MAEETNQVEIVNNLHCLVMGRSGGGKSTFCATWPKPMLVFGFDPAGKEQAYLDRGKPGPIIKGELCYYREIFSNTDPTKVIIRYEYWGESNPDKPNAYARFVKRALGIESDIAQHGYKTVIADTATFFELSARYYSEYDLNKDVKDGRQHYAFSTKQCEKWLMSRWPNLITVNSIVCCHIDDQKDESEEGGVVIKKMAALPGKLPNRITGAFSEVYRVYYAGEKAGKPVHLLQTRQRQGNSHDCKSLAGVRDNIAPHYEAVIESLKEVA